LFAGVITGFVAASMLDKGIAWLVIIVGALTCALGAFGSLFIAKLAERSAALRDLFEAQKDYEILLRTAWEERDQLQETHQRVLVEYLSSRHLLSGLATSAHIEPTNASDK
jgi:hypothetical protein